MMPFFLWRMESMVAAHELRERLRATLMHGQFDGKGQAGRRTKGEAHRAAGQVEGDREQQQQQQQQQPDRQVQPVQDEAATDSEDVLQVCQVQIVNVKMRDEGAFMMGYHHKTVTT